MNAAMGMHKEAMRRKEVAKARTSSVVLYTFGNNGAAAATAPPSTTHTTTEKAIIRPATSFASSILPAPRICPTITEIALPIAINTTLNRLEIVVEIFSAATVCKPRTE